MSDTCFAAGGDSLLSLQLVSRIEGSYSNVVGLPVCEVVLALQHHGFLGAFP